MRARLLRPVALAALVAWVATFVGPTLLPHDEVLDLVCSDEAWASPHPTTQIEPLHESVEDVHCVVCHLQRAAREAAAERVRVALVSLDAESHERAACPAPLTNRAGNLPARAPPSSLPS
jgi:hypothetical protein